MKTLIALFVVFSALHPLRAQDSESGQRKYVIGSYGMEFTLGPPWNYNMISLNHHEFLYNCTGQQKCANIQISVSQLKPDIVLSEVIDNVILGLKKANPEITFNRSETTINGISFSILDSRTGQRDFFKGQTLVLAKTKHELITIVYTGAPERGDLWVKDYSVERSRFFSILNNLRIPDESSDLLLTITKSGPWFKLINCCDTLSYLISKNEMYNYCVELQGHFTMGREGEYVGFQNNFLTSYLDEKKLFLKGREHENPAILTYINRRANMAMNFGKPQAKIQNYYFETFEVDLPKDNQAIIWRLADYNGKQMKESNMSKMVFVSLDVGDYFYTIEIIQRGDQLFGEQKELLTKLIKSLKYGDKSQLDSAHLCTRKTGGY